MAQVEDNTVRVDSGLLSGIKSPNNTTAYLGVPYAAPPLGDLRWRAPQPPQPWEGVRTADTFGPASLQLPPPTASLFAGRDTEYSEDCLYLNIYTEHTDGQGSLTDRPVLVWFHFGAFQFGSGSNPMHNGSLFAAQGVVVVTVNHRLGRFGFLAHPDLSAESENNTSGNYGLLDQIASLEWVQRNIKAFGGDPTNVAIGGASSGGASVHLLRVSPLAEGLFTKAICESGPGVAPAVDGLGHVAAYTTLSAAEQTGTELLDIIGVSSIEELRQLPADQILMPQLPRIQGAWKTALWPFSTSLSVFDAATPIIDGHVVPKSPLSALLEGRLADVPTLAGNVAHEACGLPGLGSLTDYKSYLECTFGVRADEVFQIYPASNDSEVFAASSELLADQCFVWSTWASARLQARNLTSPVWYYRFNRVPPIPTDSEIIEKDGAGAFHVCGSLYAFGNLDAWDWDWTDGDRGLSKDVQQSWVHFMKTGNPNRREIQGFGSWPALGQEDENIRIWDVESGLEGQGLRLARVTAFWDSWYGLE